MANPVLKQISVEALSRGRYQPRKEFDQEALEELAQSIRANGIVQPIVVRPLGTEGKFEIIAGERRWRAAQLAQLGEVSCLVNNYTDEQAAEVTTIENINRVDLNPIEEAQAYQRLIKEFGYIHEEIAAATGKHRTKITNALRLLKLAPYVQELLSDRRLSEGHGKVLAGIPQDFQIELAKRCIARAWSVRNLEREAKKLLSTPESQRSIDDPNLRSLEQNLAQHMGSPVKIDYDSNGRGRLVFDFHNLEILQGMLKKMSFDTER